MRVEVLLGIVGMAVVTFCTRFVCLALFRRGGVPACLERWLKHMPTSILTALIVPSLLLPGGTLDISVGNHYLLAGCVAGVVAYKSRNIVVTLALGLLVMLALRRFAA
jgi:branched-subunit amino acid transport protein